MLINRYMCYNKTLVVSPNDVTVTSKKLRVFTSPIAYKEGIIV